ncbi:TetR/AcrR family transcriptional regulator [Caulobacter vibrioides]|uniref:TetR/AcrR family transcriptional regulator n=1 Tax=Caulobacter vibrioides TaxID=155892 RepID=A0A290MG28_CAUVI|nr:TetR/AcrR family transcriptional regulator [Caulobacter vibrioides]ATC31016.1 TetR/AcrR family transcriptional regulator [Caulobacter vibrioides]
MNVRDEQRARVIAALADHLLATGLSQASLRQLAAAAGVSDRMLLYYFADKTEVLALAMQSLAGGMAAQLETALPADQRLSQAALTAKAARLVVDPVFRPFMRLWIEAIAAAARQEPPFDVVARQIGEGFLAWIEARLDPALVSDPPGAAATILALLDGLALLEVCGGEDRVQSAVAALEAAGLG